MFTWQVFTMCNSNLKNKGSKSLTSIYVSNPFLCLVKRSTVWSQHSTREACNFSHFGPTFAWPSMWLIKLRKEGQKRSLKHSKIRNSWVFKTVRLGSQTGNLPASGWEEHPPGQGNHLWSGKWERQGREWKSKNERKKRKIGQGSPSAVLILEVSVVECVRMMKTKYSGRGGGRGKGKMLRWTGQSTRSKRHFHMFICHGWNNCDKHFHLISKPIQK